MSAITNPLSETPAAWMLPYRGKVGMTCLIFAESAIFTIFVVAYLFYVGKESHWAYSARSVGNAYLLHYLSAVQQFDDPLCREASGTRQTRRIPALMAAHHRSRRPLSVWH